MISTSLFANVAQIVSMRGTATVERLDKVLQAKVGLKLEEKDVIKTAEHAKMQIIFKDETIVTIGKESVFDIYEYVYDTNQEQNNKTDFRFLKGSFKSITGAIGKIAPSRFKIKTSTATIGIRGTTVLGNQRIVACLRGKIVVSANGVTVVVPKGMFTRTLPKAPPSTPMKYTQKDLGKVDVDVSKKQEKKEKSPKSAGKKEEQQQKHPKKRGEPAPTVKPEESSLNQEPQEENAQQVTARNVVVEQVKDIATQAESVIQEVNYEAKQQDVGGSGGEILSLDDLDVPATTTPDNLQIDTTGLHKSSIYGDEYLEYGYWENGQNEKKLSYLSGVVTPSNTVEQMINSGSSAHYSGGVSSIVTKADGTQTASGGSVALDFDFANQQFSGKLNVSEGDFRANVAGNVHKYGFDATSVTNNGGAAKITNGTMNGQFYGTNAQDAGGKFTLESSNAGTANGVFGLKSVVAPTVAP